MKAVAPQTFPIPKTFGWSTVPCPGCHTLIRPGQTSLVVSGEWVPWHTTCHSSPPCDLCEGRHPEPNTGACLL